jgi:hypothetical protein
MNVANYIHYDYGNFIIWNTSYSIFGKKKN